MSKVFGIGFNKTATTSLSLLLGSNGFNVAPQKPFEYNMESYYYCRNTLIEMINNDYNHFNFFQDIPFSLPDFYRDLDKSFPDAKFILTVRDNDSQWYNSLVNMHRRKFTHFDNPKKITMKYEGWLYNYLTRCYGSPEDNPYCEVSLKSAYNKHISDVIKYFEGREDKLLVCNIKDEDLIDKLESFLERPLHNKYIPHFIP